MSGTKQTSSAGGADKGGGGSKSEEEWSADAWSHFQAGRYAKAAEVLSKQIPASETNASSSQQSGKGGAAANANANAGGSSSFAARKAKHNLAVAQFYYAMTKLQQEDNIPASNNKGKGGRKQQQPTTTEPTAVSSATFANHYAPAVSLLQALNHIVPAATAASSNEQQQQQQQQDDKQTGERLALAVGSGTSPVMTYNLAVLHYHLGQYSACHDLLEPLFQQLQQRTRKQPQQRQQVVESLSWGQEDLVVRVGFLLLDLYLTLKQTAKASIVVAFLEKLILPASSSSSSDGHHKTPLPSSASANAANAAAAAASSNSASGNSEDSSDNNSSLSVYKPHLHLYKAKLQIITRSTNATKRELKLAEAALEEAGQDSNNNPTFAFLKANLDYLRRNYRKALKLLNASHKKYLAPASTSSGNKNAATPSLSSAITLAITPLYFNNMGCMQYHLSKYNAACFYLSKGLQENMVAAAQRKDLGSGEGAFIGSKETGLVGFATTYRDWRTEIFYNQGMQLLLTGKPDLAFRCFKETISAFHRKPKLWLRLAECCIALHLLKIKDQVKVQKSSVVSAVIGEGKNRRVVLPSSYSPSSLPPTSPVSPISPVAISSSPATSGSSSPAASSPSSSSTPALLDLNKAEPTLQYARRCIQNALYLLANTSTQPPSPSPSPSTPSATVSFSSSSSSGGTKSGDSASKDQPPAAPSKDAARRALHNACLLLSSYLALCTNDPVVALSSANELIAQKTTATEQTKFLAHTYAAEALCLLSRPVDAAQHLSTCLQLSNQSSSAPSIGSTTPTTTASATRASSSTSATASSSMTSPRSPSPYSPHDDSTPSASLARYSLYVNLATAHILQDKHAQAQKMVHQALTLYPSAPAAVLLQVYLELWKGHTASALEILKKGRYFPTS
ncbi:CCR4-NOT transcription complex subunit 10 [Balamuthia mandrillaris]